MLTDEQAATAAMNLLKSQHTEYTERIQTQQAYLDGNHSSVYVPKSARGEYRWMVQRSQVNILPLVVDTLAQALYVEGWRGDSATDPAGPWQVWQANRMDARQTAVHRAALAHGEAFCVVLPGDTAPLMRPVGPLDLFALYDDPVNDEWPLMALERRPNGSWRLHEPEFTHPLAFDGNTFIAAGDVLRHGLGVTPVVRFVNRMDLSGRIVGEIEPLIKVQDQINSTTFGLLMAQTYAAFRQRWATGMVTEDEDGNELPPPNVSVARILTSDSPDTKFGEFEATDLSGYINSREASLKHAAIISQVPPHHLLGQMANLSAEALAAAEAGQMRKIAERQALFGESWEQALRLTALLAGDTPAAQDISAQVLWRDPESRSLSQYADALGKIAAQLQVPPQVLWEKLPGVTQTDVERWRDEAADTMMADARAQATAFGVTGVSVSDLPDADDGAA